MKRPDLESVLSPLKPFQRRTVDHAFERLFLAADSTARFLVADEVGLGKTLVARGIIGRAVDHLWDSVKRIDVVYICSNASIARSNLPKLQVGADGERSFALATRLTMLATQLAPKDDQRSLKDSKLNLVSFTPGTSFAMGQSTGMAAEREVLFHLLAPLVGQRTGLMNLLQGGITRTDLWRARLASGEMPLDPGIAGDFARTFRARPEHGAELDELIDTWFFRYRESWPDEARQRRNQLISKLRRILAEASVNALEPDLLILDEFQRFKGLLENRAEVRDPAAEIFQTLVRTRTPEGQPVRTLLLSATPYKLYTADAEIEHEDHYEDFLATTRFLLDDDESRVQTLRGDLAGFGTALKRAAAGSPDQVAGAKARVESALRRVMARTERVGASADRDAMVEELRRPLALEAGEVRQYLALDALFQAVGDQDPMVFWKSAPYLAHFMRGYKFNERLDEALERSADKVAGVLRTHSDAFLDFDGLARWDQVAPANAKLAQIGTNLLGGDLWKLLWIPPTLPYWPLAGAFEGQEGASKTLLFSAWNVVPDVVSGWLSYEAERRQMGGALASYQDPDQQQARLLTLSQGDTAKRARHRLLLLLLPCLALADDAHPLNTPPERDRRDWVRERVEALLADPSLPSPDDGPVDRRWEWALPVLLDPGLKAFLRVWRDDETLPRPSPKHFGDYIGDLIAIEAAELGRRPEGLAELVTEIALGSPAVLAARTLLSVGLNAETRRRRALVIADAFWRLFNRPAVIKLLEQTDDAPGIDSREEGVYWRQVLRYCRAGNLQAVLDETWHLVWEQHAWGEETDPGPIAERCATQLAEVVEPAPSRVHARLFDVDPAGAVSTKELRIRTDFALRFGDIRSEERLVSQDTVRQAFNSPFRPFVLASTSIGQEGLDFHPWCHRLVHWNLPGNPVDLEQREGRIHRYKGHAVRKNVADAQGRTAQGQWRPGDDLWRLIFGLADRSARERGESDLVPYWMAPGPWRVQRHVPLLPYTTEVAAFQRLKRQLAAYRVVFGQPRQEELMTLLEQSSLDLDALRRWAVDLAPPESEPRS